MLKAGSIFFALVIAMLIAILSSSLILLAYYNMIEIGQLNRMETLQRNATSGLELIKSDTEPYELVSTRTIDLFGSGEDSVTIIRKPWGLFEVGVSRAFKGQEEIIRSAMLGCYPDSLSKSALYLADHGKPLSVCGTTLIRGNSFIPEAGVRMANIEGQSFTGKTAIDGKVLHSSKYLPSLQDHLLNDIQRLLEKEYAYPENVKYKHLPDSLKNSFARSTIILSGNNLLLDHRYYTGNIVAIAKEEITILSSSSLNDMILIAPFIKVEKGFSGSVQLFALDSIIIGEQCQLNYPSSLTLIQTEESLKNPSVIIGSSSIVCGIVLLKNNMKSEQAAIIHISDSARVEGQVFAEGMVELKGTIYGNLTCETIMLETSASTYENYLLNAHIDYNRLSEYYIGPKLFASQKAIQVIKWVE